MTWFTQLNRVNFVICHVFKLFDCRFWIEFTKFMQPSSSKKGPPSISLYDLSSKLAKNLHFNALWGPRLLCVPLSPGSIGNSLLLLLTLAVTTCQYYSAYTARETTPKLCQSRRFLKWNASVSNRGIDFNSEFFRCWRSLPNLESILLLRRA